MANKYAEAFPVDPDQNLCGLTKREYAAIHILAGLVQGVRNEVVLRQLPEDAIELADKLLDRL